MPFHNLQQMSDAIDQLQSEAGKSNEREAAFIVAQVQPLSDAISKLQTAVSELQSKVAAIVGTAPKP